MATRLPVDPWVPIGVCHSTLRGVGGAAAFCSSIPNLTENGQKWKKSYTGHAQHFLQTEQKSFLFILATLKDFAEHAQFCSILITESFCWKKLTFCLTQTVVFSWGQITNFCSDTESKLPVKFFMKDLRYAWPDSTQEVLRFCRWGYWQAQATTNFYFTGTINVSRYSRKAGRAARWDFNASNCSK
jgi:hypothetical protein